MAVKSTKAQEEVKTSEALLAKKYARRGTLPFSKGSGRPPTPSADD